MNRVGVALLLAACGCSDPVAPPAPERPASHVRMVSTLAVIPSEPDGDYFTDLNERQQLTRKVATTREAHAPHDLVAALTRLSAIELRAGDAREAIEYLQSGLDIVERHTDKFPKQLRILLTFRMGVAFLRLGETENCCLRWTPDSCIFPIRGSGVHTRPEGSKAAMEWFGKVVAQVSPEQPLHRTASWLMNIAAMTLGSYPDGVPVPARIPPEAFQSDEEFPRFRNIAPALGLDTISLSGGAAADDFDGDGDLDLIVSSWSPTAQLRVWKNQGDGSFVDATEKAGVVGITGGLNLVHADYDNDGDLDVYVLRGAWVGGKHPNSLLRNRGDGFFDDVTFAVGLGEQHCPTQTAAWADYDLDGDLDLYVGNESSDWLEFACQLFRNDGAKGFVDVAAQAGVENRRFAKAVTWGDYDHDRYPDLYVSNLDHANRLYRNRGDGTFEEVAARAGVQHPKVSFPTWFWDYDNDGSLDLLVHAYAASIADVADGYRGQVKPTTTARLYRGDGKGGFEEVAAKVGLARPTLPMGSNFGDLDGDGWLDVYLGTGAPPYFCLTPNLMLLNRQGARFADVTTAGGFGNLQKGHAIVFADFDQDGDADVFEQMGGAYAGDAYADALYENPGFGNRWISLELRGEQSNRFGVGSRIRIELTAAGGRRTIYRHVNSGGSFGSNPFRQLIGLGGAERIESIEVFWPRTGKTQRFRAVALDRAYLVVEGASAVRTLQRPPIRLDGSR